MYKASPRATWFNFLEISPARSKGVWTGWPPEVLLHPNYFIAFYVCTSLVLKPLAPCLLFLPNLCVTQSATSTSSLFRSPLWIMHVKNPKQCHRMTFLNQILAFLPVTSKIAEVLLGNFLNWLTFLSFQQLTETCEATDATEPRPRQEAGLAHAMFISQNLECRRASQEDMALEDTASQQSLSEEQ